MKELAVMETERVAEDYFEVLGLLPTAPHDLVVEVYWHSAHRLQGAASTDPSAQALLVRLNQAYAWLTNPGDDQRANLLQRPSLEKHYETVATKRRGWLARLMRRAPKSVQASPNHWGLLDLLPSASPELVKLAYDFWRRRLRGSLGEGAEPALARLSEAYQAIVAAASTSLDQADAGLESLDSSNEVQQQAGNETEPPALEALQTDVGIDDVGTDSEETEPPALADLQTDESIDSEEVEALEEQPARSPRASRVWRAIVSTSGAAGQRTGRLLNTGRERIGKWASDPFHEYDRQAQLELELQIPDIGDERLRSLAITVETERPRIDESRSQAHLKLPSSTFESDTEHDPASPAARLVAENGMSWEIGEEALSIGSDPTCDITAGDGTADTEHVTARIWARGKQVVLHALAPEPSVLVNGQRVTWAILEDGDAVQVCGMMLRFKVYITGEGRTADVAGG